MLQNDVDLFCILIPVIIHKQFLPVIQIRFHDLGDNIILQDRAIHGPALQSLRSAPFRQIANQARIKKIQLRSLYQPFQKIIGK